MEIPNYSGTESSCSKRNYSTSLKVGIAHFCEKLPVLPHFCQWAKEMDPFGNDLLLGQLSVTSPTRKLNNSALTIWCHLSNSRQYCSYNTVIVLIIMSATMASGCLQLSCVPSHSNVVSGPLEAIIGGINAVFNYAS